MAYTTINKPSLYFNTVLYTGNGTSQSITSVGFQPDLTWLKGRSFSPSIPALIDSVRGRSKDLYSDRTSAEETSGPTEDLTSFDTNGFSLGTSARFQSNNSGQTFVSWNWLASNSTVSNTSGTISSTVSANTTAGFSIVSYTGNATAGATVGHGLGATPSMIIIKQRDTTKNWFVYHTSIGNTGYILLNTSDAQDKPNSTVWNNSGPSSTTFTLGSSNGVNTSSGTYIAYCLAEVKGFSKFGSYTGNGSANGTFVYTGFKPAFIMIKSSSSAAGNWLMQDNKRLGYNPSNSELFANLSNAEGTNDRTDLLSNGFKARINSGENNSSGVTYIYAAFAENPFVSSTFIPTTAR